MQPILLYFRVSASLVVAIVAAKITTEEQLNEAGN